MTVLATTLALVVGAGTAQAAVSINYTCSPAPTDCTGWYRTDVTITWVVGPPGATINSGCVTTTVNADTPGTEVSCSATFNGVTETLTPSLKIDKTPPTVTATEPARAPDANGWYRQPVTVTFRGSDATSGIASCTTPTYAGPDSAAATVVGTCTDAAGNTSAGAPFSLRYDSTAPVITKATAARKPDSGHWYTRPVRWSFTATDALSGLDQCPPVLVAPSVASPAASFAGSCTDRAGNVASRVFALPYDATPPAVPRVVPEPRDGAVRLVIQASADTDVLRITRAPGLRGAGGSKLYQGRPMTLTDRRVVNGRRYRYTVTAIDQAGNVARRHVAATPGPRLLVPAAGASVVAPPLLTWTPVRRASYYNVQLFLGRHKVLSAWPVRPTLQLQSSWRFGGHTYRLVPGRYRWYVWPGFGARSARRFGPLVGRRSFVVAG
jgi:hypothetical protein